MTFEPFRSVVLSGGTTQPAPPAKTPTSETIVERPGVGPTSSGESHPVSSERPESLHHLERSDNLEEIVRPASTVLTKEWVFAQTQDDVESALGKDGPREATISPAQIPAARPAPTAPLAPRTDRVAPVANLHMAPLPAQGLREETTGGVPSLHGSDFHAHSRADASPTSGPNAPRQFVVAYDGNLIGTYRGEQRTANATVYQMVAEQLRGQIAEFEPERIRLFQLTEIPRSGSPACFDGDHESDRALAPIV